MTTSDIPSIAAAIRNSTSLHGLLANLRAFETAIEGNDTESALIGYGIDLTNLPTFGGEEPNDTDRVWSWDETCLLVGTGRFRDWRIAPRPEVERSSAVEAMVDEITTGMDEGVAAGAWTYGDAGYTADVAIEFYALDDNTGTRERWDALGDGARLAVETRVAGYIARRNVEAAA